MRVAIASFLLLIAGAVAADRDLAGKYTGEWKSGSSGNGGTIRFTLTSSDGGAWKSDLSFDLDGSLVKTTMREVKLSEGKIELVYDFEIQGVTARSKVKGEWNGSAFRGNYETSLADGSQGIDGGTWSASRGQ
jgi:major membrane immunogen (membrane-anchored lipoprotein)